MAVALQAPVTTVQPPRYKMTALVLLGLYPLLLVLDLVLGPFLSGFPRPVGLLISLLISVPLMVGCVLPWLTKVFSGWLHPVVSREQRSRIGSS